MADVGAQEAIALELVRVVVRRVGDGRVRALVRLGVHVELEVAPEHPEVAVGEPCPVRLVRGGASPDARLRAGRVEARTLARVRVDAVVLRAEREGRAALAVVLHLVGQLGALAEQRELVAEADGGAPGGEEVALRDEMHPFEVLRVLRHDVDDAEHRLGPVEHRPRSEAHLDVVDELERDPRAPPEVRRPVPLLVDRVAVDEQEHVVAVVSREQHAARPDLDVVEVVLRHHPERQEVDGLREGLDAVAAEIFRRDDGDRRRRLALVLGRLRGRRDHRLAQGRLEVRGGRVCVSDARGREKSAREESREGPGQVALHWMTRIRLRAPASIDTFCLPACGRFRTRVGFADTRSKPRTTPWDT